MIFIISHPSDVTTDNVIKWLKYYGYNDIVRLNTPNRFKVREILLKSDGTTYIELDINECIVSLDQIRFIWYRNNPLIFDGNFLDYLDLDINLKNFYGYEWNKSRDFILNEFMKKPMLGNFFDNYINKLKNLKIAAQCGFLIPETIVSEYGNTLKEFCSDKLIITKPIHEICEISEGNSFMDMHTAQVSKDNIFPRTMDVPCLIQKKIEKWIELRVFVFYDKIYAMAIFSQLDKSSQVDSRSYNNSNPIRKVPYKLSKDIENKILSFMKKCNYSTGSIDLIISEARECFFIEINPVGVIEMLEPCSYDIEKSIAKEIIKRYD